MPNTEWLKPAARALEWAMLPRRPRNHDLPEEVLARPPTECHKRLVRAADLEGEEATGRSRVKRFRGRAELQFEWPDGGGRRGKRPRVIVDDHAEMDLRGDEWRRVDAARGRSVRMRR